MSPDPSVRPRLQACSSFQQHPVCILLCAQCWQPFGAHRAAVSSSGQDDGPSSREPEFDSPHRYQHDPEPSSICPENLGGPGPHSCVYCGDFLSCGSSYAVGPRLQALLENETLMKTLGIDASIDDIAAFQARPCGACGHRADEHWHLFGSQRYLCPTVATFTEVEAAVLRVPEAASGWQLIETAPKDGTRVLIFDKSWCGGASKVSVSYWQPYKFNGEMRGSWSGVTFGTHWMPLPDPPSAVLRVPAVPQQDGTVTTGHSSFSRASGDVVSVPHQVHQPCLAWYDKNSRRCWLPKGHAGPHGPETVAAVQQLQENKDEHTRVKSSVSCVAPTGSTASRNEEK